MANGKKTGGRDFEPGESGNPNGRPKLTIEQREFRNAAKKEVIEEFKYLWSLSIEELSRVAGRFVYRKTKDEEGDESSKEWAHIPGDSEHVPLLRIAIAKALLKAAQTGDMHQLNQILDRVIGKVKEEIDHNVNGNVHVQLVDIINRLESKEDKHNGDKSEETSEEDT